RTTAPRCAGRRGGRAGPQRSARGSPPRRGRCTSGRRRGRSPCRVRARDRRPAGLADRQGRVRQNVAVSGFTTRVLSANGIRLAVRDEGAGPAVVLCHGFPELAYSWRHQVPALVEAGFRVLVPDQRGYGDSDRSDDVAAYDIHHLTGDLVGLLDALDIE